MRRALVLFSVASAIAFAACRPDFGERESLVTRARLVAVRAEPPEAPPGKDVTLTALVAAPEGTVASPAVEWAFCATPKPLTENDVAATDCLGVAVRPVGVAPAITATLPADACQLFGPEPPPGGYRPRDADVSGGFYQPLRAFLLGASSIALLRVSCNLGNASADVAADFKTRYHPNQNPKLSFDVPAVAARGEHLVLRASWRPEDAEAYVSFDVAAQAVVDRREAMRVSWFVSAGALDADRTGRGEAELDTSADGGWTAPSSPGAVHVWIVLRDSRGGVDFGTADVNVH